MMSFDDALTHANFSFVYFLQFYLLIFFDIFQWGFEPPNPPLATPLVSSSLLMEFSPGSDAHYFYAEIPVADIESFRASLAVNLW